MGQQYPLEEMYIADILAQWPSTAHTFQTFGMACVGCAVAPFYTLREASNIYQLNLEQP